MSRPLSRPEAIAAAIWAEAARRVAADAPRDWNEADETWVDRVVATTCTVTGERWVPARRSGR